MKYLKPILLAATCLLTLPSFGIPKSVLNHAILKRHNISPYLAQGQIKASEFCFSHDKACVVASTYGSAIPTNIMTTGDSSFQTYKKAIGLAESAAITGINTAPLAVIVKQHPLAKEIQNTYFNGVPFVFDWGGYFAPTQGRTYGLGIVIQNPSPKIAVRKQLNQLENIFHQGYKSALTKNHPFKLSELQSTPKGMLKTDVFQTYIAAAETAQYCNSIGFACAAAVSNPYGQIISLYATVKIIPIYITLAMTRAEISGMSGSTSNVGLAPPGPPGLPLFHNSKYIGSVVVTFVNLNKTGRTWRPYYQILEAKYAMYLKQLQKKYG